MSRDPIDELPSGFDGALGVKTSSANKQAINEWIDHMGVFSKM